MVDKAGLDPSAAGRHDAELKIDYVLLDGRQYPVKTLGGIAFSYTVAALGARPAQLQDEIAVVICLNLGGQITQTTFNGETGGGDLAALASKTVDISGIVGCPQCAQKSAGFDLGVPGNLKVVGASIGNAAPTRAPGGAAR